MSDNTAPIQNITAFDPNLKDLLDLFKKDIMLSLNCHAIATIESFDGDTQTCTATLNYKKTFMQPDSGGNYVPVLVDYPLLVDVPVIILQGGKAVLTFPIVSGDTCLILFNDRDIDAWFESGQVGPVPTQRFHSFADGIALVGLNSLNNSLKNYDPLNIVLMNLLAKILIGPTGVIASYGPAALTAGPAGAYISNGSAQLGSAGGGSSLLRLENEVTSLKTVLSSMTSLMGAYASLLESAFAAATQNPGDPINPTASSQFASQLTTVANIQNLITELLE